MPKFGGHIEIGEGVAKVLAEPRIALEGATGAALRLGAIGPDLTLFLFDPTDGDPNASFAFKSLQQGLRTYAEIRKIRDQIDEIDRYIGKPSKDLADWFTGGFSTSILESIGLGIDSFFAALKLVVFFKANVNIVNPFQQLPHDVLSKLFGVNIPSWVGVPEIDLTPKLDPEDITSPAYIFRYFGAPYTNDPPFKKGAVVGDYKEWWWMDILHYRRTTTFARRLLDIAMVSDDPVKIAYAVGYFSHVGGDIVGHPYINSMVGGPFRTHALRHMVVESLVDVQLWHERRGDELINSRLDKLVSLDDEDLRSVAELINQAMQDVYITPIDGSASIATANFGGGAPSVNDIRFAYETMLGYLGNATDLELEEPNAPPESLGELWDEIREHIAANIDEINKYVTDLRTKSGWDWLLALIGLIAWSAILAVKLLTLPPALVARIMTIAPRWLFYLINCALYDFVRNVRYAMALCGWGYASEKDLMRGPSKDLLTIRSPLENDKYMYPYAMTKRTDGFWLEFPGNLNTPPELPKAIPGPYRLKHTPSDFIDQLAYDLANDALLQHLSNSPPAGSPIETQTLATLHQILDASRWESPFLGNAVEFSLKLIQKNYPDGLFDLDGDRGYAFLQWQDYPPNSTYVE